MATEEPEGVRPSFTDFWKKTKQLEHGNRVEFVQQEKQTESVTSSESPEAPSESPAPKTLSKSEKAKLRRAQVRRAQIQHRQRKAEYVTQLEIDVSHFRELIALTQSESAALREDNADMRAQLEMLGINFSPLPLDPLAQPTPMEAIEEQIEDLLVSDQQPMDLATSLVPGQADSSQQAPELFGDINIDDVIVTLKTDPLLRTPVFSVRSSSGSASSNSGASDISDIPSPPSSIGNIELTAQEEQLVVNFILAMEHICWDHFGEHADQHHPDNVKGHTLMASTFCMARAPPSVYRSSGLMANPSGCGALRALSEPIESDAVIYEWSSSRISLSNLCGLASSLVPGDTELTPVQAWFELQDKYPRDVLLNPQILHCLSRELNGVVKCLEFGAVMQRDAFESVVERMLGPTLEDLRIAKLAKQAV